MYTSSYIDHRYDLAYLYQFELFLEVSRLRRGVSGTVSGFAVTSATKVEFFIPTADQGFAILPTERERRCLQYGGGHSPSKVSKSVWFRAMLS